VTATALDIADSGTADTGLEVIDLLSDSAFARRRPHPRDVAMQMEGLRRLASVFVERPDTILQQLVNTAADLCGAASAGISVEQEDEADANCHQWVATTGAYVGFLNATLPGCPSACAICLERGRPQRFRVSQRFFDRMGVIAPIVTDGILLPWHTDHTRGTIWIMAHDREEAFDGDDLRMMQVLADFAAMAIRHRDQQRALLKQASAKAAAAMADRLAHQINNPLQSITNILYLAGKGESGSEAKTLAEELSDHLQRLSGLVARLLALPETSRHW